MINLVFDANNHFHRCKNVLFTELGNLETAQQEGVLMRKVATDFFYIIKMFSSVNRVIWAQDHSSWRKQIKIVENTGYKGNREPDNKFNWPRFYDLMNDFGKIIESKGGIYSSMKYAEADDLASLWAQHFFKEGENTIVVTADRDLQQIAKWNGENWLLIYDANSKSRKLIAPMGFQENFLDVVEASDIFNMGAAMGGSNSKDVLKEIIQKSDLLEVDVKEFAFIKVLHGDKGDNVPAVFQYGKGEREFRVSEKKALKYYETELGKHSILDYYRNEDLRIDLAKVIADDYKNATKDLSLENKPDVQKIADNIKRNVELVYLNYEIIPDYITDGFDQMITDKQAKKQLGVFKKNLNRISLLEDTKYAKEDSPVSNGWSAMGGVDLPSLDDFI